ncbi:MAG: hypothetical protein CMO06_02205 [Thalassospira sp.]|uniref:DUF2231 domain-containing protein n=1 Tax=Thalassospira sp. TaxID=1912094 RepID=UPI000C3F9203|nr:DUF2231 domain-containing protein [Thalassospira sp.]MAZ31951.1 hypothetical protein [Thalassospira sp.]|tara:strand:+ start:1235 stop:1672 length:438 start_codon:yes stop_codon:yes gene_type:complete
MLSQPNLIGRYPFRAVFVPFPYVAFTFAFFADILYWQTSNLMWQNFSAWLLFAGLVFGALAILAGLADFLRENSQHYRSSWAEASGYIVVLVLGFFNSLVHAGDGWTAIVPTGITLSGITVLAILITLWLSANHPFFQKGRIPND